MNKIKTKYGDLSLDDSNDFKGLLKNDSLEVLVTSQFIAENSINAAVKIINYAIEKKDQILDVFIERYYQDYLDICDAFEDDPEYGNQLSKSEFKSNLDIAELLVNSPNNTIYVSTNYLLGDGCIRMELTQELKY